MVEDEINDQQFGAINQVIGVAYTYCPSLAVRLYLTKNITAHHSSKHTTFSYFYKGNNRTIVRTNQTLYLRTEPATGRLVNHWPEPELAVLLGENHEIIAYTLANDLTAIEIEMTGRTHTSDGTHEGKAWYRSGSIGPKFIAATAIGNPSELEIGLTVIRQGRSIYNQSYSTSRRLRSFNEIPDAIISYYKQFGDCVPPSKQILIGPNGYLPAGTVIMLGTGLIVQKQYYCEHGDILIVKCSEIGELTNRVIKARHL